MRIFIPKVKKIVLIIFVALLMCIAFFYFLMFRGVSYSYFTENYSHIISVENIDPNLQDEQIQQKPLILDDGTSVEFFVDCPDISRTVYIQSTDNRDTLYLDNGRIVCTYPEGVLQKNINTISKSGYLLSIGQKWKTLGPVNYFDQPTGQHTGDCVFKVDILNGELDVVFESKAKERVLYADFEVIITYHDGVINYYDSSSGEGVKTVDATFMQKRQKYVVKCIGDVLVISTKGEQLAKISIK